MFRGLPPAQRRLLLLSIGALVLAVGFVVVAVLFAVGRPAVRTPEEYRPFKIEKASVLAESVARHGPAFFADPTGGERGFVVQIIDRDLVALRVIPPGHTSECPVDWKAAHQQFEDCRGTVWSPRELQRFPSSIDDQGIFVVDLRRVLPPLEVAGR